MLQRALGGAGGTARVADLFAGSGQMGDQIAAAGCRGRVALAAEREGSLLEAVRKRWTGVQAFADVREVEGAHLRRVTVVTAGLPCQGLSPLGKRRGMRHRESRLLWEVPRMLDEMKPSELPPLLFFECVPELLSDARSKTMLEFMRRLNVLSYNVAYSVADARAWLPQHRRRVYVLCARGWDPAEAMFGESVPSTTALERLSARGGAEARVLATSQASPPMVACCPTLVTGASKIIAMSADGQLHEVGVRGMAALQGMPEPLREALISLGRTRACGAIGNACAAPPLRHYRSRAATLLAAAAAGVPPGHLPPMRRLHAPRDAAPGPAALGSAGVRYALASSGSSDVFVCLPGGNVTDFPCAAGQPLFELLNATPGALLPLTPERHAIALHGYLRSLHTRRDCVVSAAHARVLAACSRFLEQAVGETPPAVGETWRVFFDAAGGTLVLITAVTADDALFPLRVRPLLSSGRTALTPPGCAQVTVGSTRRSALLMAPKLDAVAGDGWHFASRGTPGFFRAERALQGRPPRGRPAA